MSMVAVSPDYFETMRIPLRKGRLLTERDVSRETMLAVISAATARQYWGSDDPVGAFGRFNRPDGQRFEVVGVVGDVKNDGLGQPSVPEIYISNAIQSVETTHFVVRSTFGTLAAYTLPARSIGGDYYDFLELPGGDLGVAIADVSGKGIAAALLMSVVQASLRLISADTGSSCAQLAAKMNRFLYGSTAGNKYATFFYAQIDMATRRLRFVNAGHNPPYLVRRTPRGAEAQPLKAGGTVLGLFPEADYEAGEVPLLPGDVLVAFTDGVSEAMNPAGEEFGEARLEALLVEGVGQSADDISARLTAAMRDWIADAEPHDDLTFVVVALNEEPVAAA